MLKSTIQEVVRHSNALKTGKSPGTDGIPAEVWKYLTDDLYKVMADNFSKMLRGEKSIPKSWKESEIRWIFKHNGSPLLITNYRPIALGNCLGKLFMRILTERIENLVERDGLVAAEQMGFRPDRSCQGAALILQILVDRANKKGTPFWWAGIDLSKAYDNVDHDILWEILQQKGITGNWLETIKRVYQQNKIRSITTDGYSEWVRVKKGIRQGCPLSPALFAIYMDWVSVSLSNAGIMEPSKQVVTQPEPNMLLYADDMAIWANSLSVFQSKLRVVIKALANLGMPVNTNKSTIQANEAGTLEHLPLSNTHS